MPNFTTSDGLKIHFEDRGAGQPLMCLAGLTRNSQDFSFLAPHVADLRMIAMDYRGRGLSDHDPNYRNYNVPREAQDVVELMDYLGLEKACILGTSRGGLIAMTLGITHPDRVAGAILNDVGPVIEPQAIARILEYVGRRPVSKTYDQAAKVLKQMMDPQFPGVPLSIWRQQAEFQYAETADGLDLRYDPALGTALAEQLATAEAPDLWPVFDALRGIPTGVLRGANSDLLSRETLEEMRARHPGLIAAEVPDRGHVPFLNEAQSVETIRKVLDMT